MALHHLRLPATANDVLKLAVGDTVYLHGVFAATGGAATHERLVRCVESGVAPPLDLGGTLVHLPDMLREDPQTGALTVDYVNPTTSMRFDRHMPTIIRGFGLKVIGGKGGLSLSTVEAMKEMGCVYMSLLGGGSPILSAGIREVVEVAWKDLPVHFRLTRLGVENFGPLTVAIDAHGNSIYETLASTAKARLPEILARLDQRRVGMT